jgi:hypothetical protein
MDRQKLTGLLILLVILITLLTEAFLWLHSPTHQLPQAHKQLLLLIALIWIFSLAFPRNRDDDWAF